MVTILAIGPTELFVDALCPQDKHIQAFRLYWRMRGVDVKTNGQRFDLRGKPVDPSKSLEQAAREYRR